MALTPVTPIEAGPAVPSSADPETTFDAALEAYFSWLKDKLQPQANALAAATYTNSQEAIASASAAAIAAATAGASSAAAVAAANFKGNWSDLTGPLNMPACVFHTGRFWVLLVNLANVAAAQPSGLSSSWAPLDSGVQSGPRNRVLNGSFSINQQGYVSGSATTAGQYVFDGWKVTGTGGVTYAASANKTTVTIPAGQTLQQVVEGLNLQTGTYVLSWEGTAQGRIAGGSYGASGAVTASITGGANTTIEFNAGTVANVQLEPGSIVSPFEYQSAGSALAMCQRQFHQFLTPSGGNTFYSTPMSALSSTRLLGAALHLPVPMRATPSASLIGTPTLYTSTFTYVADVTSISVSQALNNAISLDITVTGGVSAGNLYLLAFPANTGLRLSARL